MVLEEGIGEGVKKPEDSAQWLAQLMESITEELLTQEQIDSL